MAIVRCEKGLHLFNVAIHTVCPSCDSPASTLIDEISDLPLQEQKSTRDTEPYQFGFQNVNVTLEPISAHEKSAKEGITQEISDWLSSRYRFLMPLSRGGMGRIFLVQEVFSGRFVALKVLLERAIKDQRLVQQFIREAVITARLQHPNIIPVYDLGFVSERKLYYTMRFIDGIKFSEIIEEPRIDLIEKVRVLRNIAQATHFAHQLGLWHRDLKPENILLGSLGDTYVIDWGLVSIQPNRNYRLNLPQIVLEKQTLCIPDQLIEKTKDAVTTHSGTIMGSPAYMSPEQCLGYDNLGLTSDIWAIGIMLYQSLNNSHPIPDYQRMSKFELLNRIVAEEFPPITIKDKRLKPLVDMCKYMLVKKPAQRLPDLAIFLSETAKFVSNIGHTSTMLNVDASLAAHGNNGGSPQIEFLKEKNAILAELVSLSPFSFRRRRILLKKLLTYSSLK
jgi:serine/threonine-protein kinase